MMRLAALLLTLAAAGCAAAPSNAPSLMPRAIETRSEAIEAAPAVVVTPADPALLAVLVRLTKQVEDSKAAFDRLAPTAAKAFAAGGAEGSESWIEAQQLVSALEVAHGPVAAAMAELDDAYLTQLNAATPSGLDELRAAQARAADIARDQQAVLDRLKASIRR